MTFETARERYLHDPKFHQLVDQMHAIHHGNNTPTEDLVAAVTLAADIHLSTCVDSLTGALKQTRP